VQTQPPVHPPAGAAPRTWVSRRGGRFTRTAYLPPRILRVGNWVGDTELLCGAVLASDGKTWMQTSAEDDHIPDPSAWLELLDQQESAEPWPAFPLPRASATRAPALDRKSALGEDSLVGYCASGTYGGPHGSPPSRGIIGYPGPLARVINSVPGAPLPPTATALALLADGICPSTPDPDGGTPLCTEGAPPTRLPHVVRVDRTSGRVEIAALPAECKRSASVGAYRGLGVVSCATGEDTSAVGSFSGGTIHLEGTLPVASLYDFEARLLDDGTLGLFPGKGSSDRRVFVRTPGGGWRAVSGPDGIAYRLLPGGGVLALTAPSIRAPAGRSLVVGVVRDAPDGTTATVVDGVAVDRPIDDFGYDDRGRVWLASGQVRYGIGRDRALAPLGDAAPAAP